jgi:hypothetical protein
MLRSSICGWTRCFLGAVLMGVLVSGPSTASVITLEDFRTSEVPILIHDKLFFPLFGEEWIVFLDDEELEGDALSEFLSGIHVQPLDDDPLNPGLAFLGNGQLALGGSDNINSIWMAFLYGVSSLAGETIKDNSLELVDYELTGDMAGLGVLEWLVDPILLLDPDAVEDLEDLEDFIIAEKEVYAYLEGNLEVAQLFDAVEFAPVDFLANITLVGLERIPGAGNVELIEFHQRFSQIPEPSTLAAWSLLVAIGLGWEGWRRRPRAAVSEFAPKLHKA